MVLLHGIRDHCRSWDRIARAFFDEYRVIAPDLRGHGDSAWALGGSYEWPDYLYDVAQLVRQATSDPVTLVAHSLGGSLACLYAGVFPERVARLIVLEGIGLFRRFLGESSPPPTERLRGWIDTVHELSARQPRRYDSLEQAWGRMRRQNPHLGPEQARHLTVHGANQNEDGTYSWKFDNYTHAWPPYGIPVDDICAIWSRITAPALIVTASEGMPHRIGHDGTLDHFARAEHVEIRDAGHWVHHDQPEAVLAAMRSFLGPPPSRD
jgi:pimeloyl-ACP methyl ester carboxylesterase